MADTGSLAEIRKETAEWLVKMDADPENWSRPDFVAWLKASPLHAAEFLDQHALWAALSGMKPVGIDLDELRRESQNVIDWPRDQRTQPQESREPPATSRRGWRLPLAAASALLVVGAMVLWNVLPRTSETLTTDIGEQRSVRLSDGSLLHMNTDTQVEIHFSESTREVRLKQGEALFSVERDPQRPFRVRAGDVAFEALGTQFNVRRRATGTTLSVVEGRVAVVSDSPLAHPLTRATTESHGEGPAVAPQAATYEGDRPPPQGAVAVVGAGEQVRVGGDGSLRPEAIQNVTAWRQRKLVFENTPLSEVIAEVARYKSSPRLVIEDPTLRDRRLNGVFAADDTDSLLEFLKQEGLSITRTDNAVAIGTRESAAD